MEGIFMLDEFNSIEPDHLRFLKNCGGRVTKIQIDGYVEITFDDMSKASSWVSVCGYQDRCEIVGSGNFVDPTTIRLNLH